MSHYDSPVTQLLLELLQDQEPSLFRPDGRSLFRYRVTSERYETLCTRVRSEFPQFLVGRRPLGLAAGFVLYAAETWRRADDVSRWNTWKVVLDGLEVPRVEFPQLYSLVHDGLDYWQRPLRTLGGRNRWIATLICEGGLPLHLVRESGNRFRRYFRGVVAYVRDFGLEQLPLPVVAEQHAAVLPRSLRQEPVYELAADLVGELWKMHGQLGGREGDPISLLDQSDASWRDRLPLRLDDAMARSLLGELLRDVEEVVADRGALPRTRRWLVEHGDGWRLLAGVEVPRATSAAKFASLLDGDVSALPTHAHASVVTESVGQPPFGTTFRSGDMIQFEVLSLRRCEVEGPDAVTRIGLELDASDARWGEARAFAIPGGQALSSEQPWVFRSQDAETGRATLLADGSCRTRQDEVLVAVPLGMDVFREGESEWLPVGSLVGWDRALFRCRGRVRLESAGGDSWVVATAQPQERQLEFVLRGRQFGDPQGREIYCGPPQVVVRDGVGDVVTDVRHDGFWRPAGAGATWRADWDVARGMVDLRVRTEGETRLGRQVAVLPADFSCAIDNVGPRSGCLRLRGIAGAAVLVKAAPGLAVEQRPVAAGAGVDLDCSADGEAPVSLGLRLHWSGAAPVDLVFPTPLRSAHFVTGTGEKLAKGYVALDDFFGLKAQVITPERHVRYEVSGKLRDRKGTEGVSLSEVNRKLHLVLPMRQSSPGCHEAELRHLVERVRRAMRVVPELDLQVQFRLARGGVEQARPQLEVQRYAGTLDCRWEEGWVGMATASPALARRTSDLGVRAFPLWQPRRRSVELESLPTPSPTWLFDPESRSSGPWLLYGHLHGVACTRPRLWVAKGDDMPTGTNLHERAVLAPREEGEQAQALDRLYAALLDGSDPEAREDLFALLRYSSDMPASSFATVAGLVGRPAALVCCLLGASSTEDREAVFALREGLPFDWSFLPLQAWLEGVRSAIAVLRARFIDVGFDEAEIEKLLQERCEFLLGKLPQAERALCLLLQTACAQVVPGFHPSPWVERARMPAFQQIIRVDLERLLMEARRRQAVQQAWPNLHGINTWVEANRPTSIVPPVMSEGGSIETAPWVAACASVAGTAPDAMLTLELLRARAFDAEWFDSAHERYLVLAIAASSSPNTTTKS